VCFIVRKTTSELEHVILTTMFMLVKNINRWCARKGCLQHAFPLNVSMVLSSALIVTYESQRLMCGGFSLSETIFLMSFKFIADYFSGLSLSPRRGNSSAAFIGSTHSGTPSLMWAMIENSTEEFLTASSGEGGFALSSPKCHGIGALLAPITTTPWMENAPSTQATMTLPPQMAALQPYTGLPFEQWCALQVGQRALA
jgi:hypothetical protein